MEFKNGLKKDPQTESNSWFRASDELQSALSEWKSLCEQKPRLSADEQMIQDMQNLLKKLEQQMKDF